MGEARKFLKIERLADFRQGVAGIKLSNFDPIKVSFAEAAGAFREL
jgi:hypothetical protein